jgi:hypothetical protein
MPFHVMAALRALREGEAAYRHDTRRTASHFDVIRKSQPAGKLIARQIACVMRRTM